MLIVFWDLKGLITIDFLKKCTTVNSASYYQRLMQNSLYLLNDPCIICKHSLSLFIYLCETLLMQMLYTHTKIHQCIINTHTHTHTHTHICTLLYTHRSQRSICCSVHPFNYCLMSTNLDSIIEKANQKIWNNIYVSSKEKNLLEKYFKTKQTKNKKQKNLICKMKQKGIILNRK